MKQEEQKQISGEKPYKLGIAFSGGGARGFAHAGALAAIEEAGLKPDILAGVSAGSLVAVLYAAGLRPAQFLDIFSGQNFSSFARLRPHGGGLFTLDPFKKFIEDNLGGYKNLEDLPMPVYLGVTDFNHGVSAEFHSGPIAERVVASCSIPITFHPVEIDGIDYVDGGVLRNHPAWIIRDQCEYLIGINVSPLLPEKDENNSIWNVALRTYNIMAKSNQQHDMALCDLNIAPAEIAHYAPFDLRSINNVYMSGYVTARKGLRDAGLWQTDSARI